VDLREPENRGKSRDVRFISRVFTADEKALISRSSEPDTMLWTLWAGKETAYKVMGKSRPGLSSAPRSYHVVLENQEAGKTGSAVVETPGGDVHLRFCPGAGYVHVLGTEHPDDLQKIEWGVETIDCEGEMKACPGDSSRLVREALIRRLSGYPGFQAAQMDIRRSGGNSGNPEPPVLFVNRKQSAVDVSLSHDGRFVAYAFSFSPVSSFLQS
jgi:phosphopantetheinyl transferase (holo-ACP synthase)